LQAQYLREQQANHGLTLREIARRGQVLAEALGQDQLAFSHQALSAWINGARNPRPDHRRMLAMIFHVTIDEFNRGCDGAGLDEIDADEILKPVTVEVYGNEQVFEYKLTVRGEIDLARPAVYRHWADMFRPWPAPLARHFGRLKQELFGWIPDRSGSPMVRQRRSLVPLEPRGPLPEGAESIDKQVWFVYLPDGELEAGMAFREGRSIVLSKARGAETPKRYPLSRVDLVGRVVGKALFHIRRA